MLIYFILGMIGYALAFPLVEALVSLIVTAVEVPKGWLAFKVANYNVKIQEMGEEVAGGQVTHAIGFITDDTENYDYDEEDDE